MSKTILHLDMNSYFATAEQQANPYLRYKPVGIIKAAGRGCVIAASIEAKKFGVKTGSTVWEARRLCPQIILVPSDMDKYFAITQKLIAIAGNYSPIVEVFSIDEMFLDITDTQKLYPGGILQMALEIKAAIRAEIGDYLKCSIGISFSKILAKLASEMHKPDGLTILTQDNFLAETANVTVEEVCGIGFARSNFLHDRGVFTLGQARKLPDLPADLTGLVWLRINDELITIDQLDPAKSVSRTYTTFKTLNAQDLIQKLVRNLIEEAAAKLREMGMAGRTLYLALDARHYVKTLKNPLSDPQIIFNLLWSEYLCSPVESVRFAGVNISNLIINNQLSMFNKSEKVLKVVDSVNDKFGLFTVYPGSLMGGELIRPEITGYLGDKYYRFKFGS